MVLALPFAALVGLAIGSFLNVVAWRLPRGESLSSPPSHCRSCDTPIRAYDNVPVLSWLLLRGSCRSCGERIAARYPIVEAVTAALYVAVVAANWGDAAAIALGVAFVTLLVPVTLIDVEHQIIPNKLTGPFALVAVAIGAALHPAGVPEQLIAGAAAAGFFFAAVMAYPRGMGMGDVKLAGVMGLFLGRAVGPAVFIALVAGVVVGVILMARKGVAEGRSTKIPFGPFLALGSIVALFAGDDLVSLYLGRF